MRLVSAWMMLVWITIGLSLFEFKSELTWDGVLAALALLGSAGLTVFFLGRWWWHRRRSPFDMRFPTGDYGNPQDRPKTRQAESRSSIIVQVGVLRPMLIERFNVRCVQRQRRWWRRDTWSNAASATIWITDLWHHEHEYKCERVGSRTAQQPNIAALAMMDGLDTAGGREGHFAQPLRRGGTEALWIGVCVYASQPWSGYLGFRCRDGDGVERYARRKLTIVPAPTPGTPADPPPPAP